MRTARLQLSVPTGRAGVPSDRALRVAAMFGLGLDDDDVLAIVPETALPLPAGGVVFITGPSGGGKSTLLRLIDAWCRQHDVPVVDLGAAGPTPPASLDNQRPLVDLVGGSLGQATALLSRAGLGDAFTMLRCRGELSDGQAWRFRLALGLDALERGGAEGGVLLADEFTSTLDRLTASVVARNVARWVRRSRHTLVCATTHDDILEALEPEVLVDKALGAEIAVHTRDAATGDH